MRSDLFTPIKCKIMGVLNVTPDSFSDGGKYFDPKMALQHLDQLVSDGADIVDIGAESTRPGAKPVPSNEEWSRLRPLLEHLRKSASSVKVSIDTRKPELMLKAADFGVGYINDVDGGRDPSTLALLARNSEVSFIAMHMHGDPQTMQDAPLSGIAGLREIDDFFTEKSQLLAESGFPANRIYLDPGFGFGKNDDLNAKILASIPVWVKKGLQVAIGVSRKSFFGRMLDIADPVDRDPPSKICELATALLGVSIIRTHNVRHLKNLLSLVG